MASLNNVIDHDAELPGDFEIFEAGPQPMEVVESDIVTTKAGTGKLLKYRLRITQGDLENRLIFGQFNLTNPNPVAAKIGQGEFKALRELVEVPEPEDTSDLHFREFIGVVKVTPAKGDYKAKNEVDWGASHKLAFGGEAAAPVAANDNEPAPKATPKAAPKPAPGARKAPWPSKAAA